MPSTTHCAVGYVARLGVLVIVSVTRFCNLCTMVPGPGVVVLGARCCDGVPLSLARWGAQVLGPRWAGQGVGGPRSNVRAMTGQGVGVLSPKAPPPLGRLYKGFPRKVEFSGMFDSVCHGQRKQFA